MSSDASSVSGSVDSVLGQIIEDAVAAVEAGRPVAIEELISRHPELADELRELLPAAEMLLRMGDAESPPAGASHGPHPLPFGRQPLGDFQILSEIGRGGMGVVYEAEQLSLGRRVALKVLPLAAMLDKQHLVRFQIEARAAATLNHPHIVPVYAVGCDRGVHYYAMQLIEGQSLAQALDVLREQRRLEKQTTPTRAPSGDARSTRALAASSTVPNRDTREYFRTAARLIAEAAEALQHAHDRGILHRDVKPANLLIDETSKLWVADFGLAQLGGQSELTLTGDLVGTLRYMSPEQALGKRALIDCRADVYSLGATLFELLTLEPVYSDADREGLLAKLALAEPRLARQVNRQVPVDLETIAAKSLQRDPADRYESAGQLAADLRRFLEAQPIMARPATVVDRLIKYLRRRPAVAASIGVTLALVSATLLVAVLLINYARRDAVSALERTTELLYLADMTTACQDWERNWPDEARLILDKHRPRKGERDQRGYEWYVLEQQTRPPDSQALAGHRGSVNELAVLPDGRLLASVGDDGTLRIWDVARRRCVRVLTLSAQPLFAIGVSPDGRYLAAGGLDSAIYLCDAEQDYAPRQLHRGEFAVESLTFAADGQSLAAGFRYEEVLLLSLNGELIRRKASRARLKSLEFSRATSSWVFPQRIDKPVGTRRLRIQQWSRDLTKLEREFHSTGSGRGAAQVARISPSGKYLVGGDEYGCRAQVFDLETGSSVAETPRSRDRLLSLAISPDSRSLAIGYRNGIVECYSIDEDDNGALRLETRPKVFRACQQNVFDLQFVDAETLATAGPDGLVRLWQLGSHEPLVRQLSAGRLTGSSMAPDGELLLCCYNDRILIVETRTGNVIGKALKGRDKLRAPTAAWSPSGEQVLVWTPLSSEPVEIFDRRGRPLATVPSSSEVVHAAMSPDGKLLATVGAELRLIDLDQDREIYTAPLPTEGARGRIVAFSHDGAQLAYRGNEPTLVVMDIMSRRQRIEVAVEEDFHALAFSPDDSLIATGHGDSLIRVWDVATGRLRHELAGHAGEVRQITFAPRGDRLLSAGADGTTRTWSLRHGRQFGILPHPHYALAIAASDPLAAGVSLSSDGRRLAVTGVNPDGFSELSVFDLSSEWTP